MQNSTQNIESMRYLFIVLFLCFGCTNTSKKESPTTSNQNATATNFSFVDSIQVYNIDHPFRVWQYRKNGKLLTKKQFELLQLNKVFTSFDYTLDYRLFANLNPTKDYKTLFFGVSDNESFGTTCMVTYDSTYNLINYKLVDNHEKKGPSNIISFVDNNSLFIENTTLNTATEFIIRESGKIEESNKPVTFKKYRYLGDFKGYIHEMPKRTVKAKSGLIVRDSIGKPIDTLPFGQIVYIVDYTKDSIVIKDNGKAMKAPKARIVLNPKKVKTGNEFYIEPTNIGYVFSGFLYDYYDAQDEADFPYEYEYLKVGSNTSDEYTTIDLREIFQIKRVDFKKYQDKIIIKPSIIISDTTAYKKGKVLTLPFENGQKLVLKDSTYKSEYNPTRSFNVLFHEAFPNDYMVSESMFFMDDKYTVLSKKTGDTLQTFTGYPYISPTKKYSVAIFNEFECMQQTYMIVNKLKDEKYQHYASLLVKSWSYPFELNKNNMLVDVFSIHWISDTEFIIYAKNPEECYMENATDYFYLKYKIK